MKKRESKETKGTEQHKSTQPEGVAPNPLLADLVLIDWSSPYVVWNEEAMKAIKELIQSCHAEVLQYILNLIKDRIYGDARLWALGKDTTNLLELGDEIYTRRGRR